MESQLPVQVLAYLECFQNVPSNRQVFRLLSKGHCHLCLTGTSLFLKPLFSILLILYRVFRSCLPAASSASSASLSTNFLLSSLVIFFTSRSNSKYFLLSWSRTCSDWVELICCLTPLLVSIFSQVFPCIHSSFFLYLGPRTFFPAALNT